MFMVDYFYSEFDTTIVYTGSEKTILVLGDSLSAAHGLDAHGLGCPIAGAAKPRRLPL